MQEELQSRHFSGKQKLIAILALVVLIAGGIGVVVLMKVKPPITPVPITTTPTPTTALTTTTPAVSTAITATSTPIPTIAADTNLYYSTTNKSSQSGSFSIRRINSNASIAPEEVFQFPSKYYYNGRYRIEPELLVSTGSKLLTLNMINRTGTTVFDLQTPSLEMNSALYDDTNNVIYYVLSNIGATSGLPDNELWQYDLNTHQSEMLTSKKLTVFTKWTLLAKMRTNDLIILEKGIDGTKVYGDLLLISRKSPSQHKVVERDNDMLLNGHLNPAKDTWLYQTCPYYNQTAVGYECAEGEQLMKYSLGGKQRIRLYQNTETTANAADQPKRRTISSSYWLDDNNVLFTQTDGIYSLNIDSKVLTPKKIYSFELTNLDEQFKAHPIIRYADFDQIIYEYSNPDAQLYRYNMLSGVSLPLNDSIKPEEVTSFFRVRT
ncbi:hypothetical protein HGA91_01000 [candidate division WWE3 bacterium]|nr:hypothetical protein [candidate division WWE3 bacterium]